MVATCCAMLIGASPVTAAPKKATLAAAHSKLPSSALPVLEGHVKQAPPIARRLARIVAPHLTFRIARGRADRAHGVPVAGGGLRFVVALLPRTWRRTAIGRFVFLHELGHVVDWAFIGPALRQRVREAFASSPAWRDCFPYKGTGCVPASEVFAEQFAYWAGARRTLRSGYGIPPLLSRDAFGDLMAEAGWGADSPLRVAR